MSKPVTSPPFKLCPNSAYLDVNIQVKPALSTRSPKLFEAIEKIGNQKKEISRVLEKLKGHYLSHKKIELQSAETALMTQLSVEIAKLLLTDDGVVNVDIIPDLIETFVGMPEFPLNHEINLSYTLKTLLSSPYLREKISQITSPDSALSPANHVIRAVLDLPSNVTPTDLHAKQTALAGLLSHLRQGSDGSCFASPIVIWLLSSDLERCVDDFASLLKSSKLTRKIQNITRDFPFLLRMSNKNLDSPIRLLKSGKLIGGQGNKGFLYEVPGFVKACESLGLRHCKMIFKHITEQLFKNEPKDKNELTTSVKKILQEVAKYNRSLDENTGGKVGLYFLTAYFAFEGQVNNPLLAVWENAIAGMAEADESSMVTSAVIETTLTVIDEKLKKTLPKYPQVIERINTLIHKELSNRIHLHYDPIVPHTSQSNVQNTTEGAFVLYDKGNYARSSCWIRIDNPHSFQAFTARVIEAALLAAKEGNNPKGTLSKITEQFEKLAQFIETDNYLLAILKEYYHKNRNIPDSIKDYKKIKYSPWVTKSGNSFNTVLQVYLEDYTQNKTRLLTPANSKDLLKKIILLGKEMTHSEQGKYNINSSLLIPARVPKVHAFSLMMGHPNLKAAWQSPQDPNTWIKEKVISPGKKIASSIISESMKQTLIECYCEHFLDPIEKENFLIKVKQLDKEQSISEFRSFMLTLMRSKGKECSTQLLDSYIYQILPDSLRRNLELSAVHFADSNWCDGLNDIHFCFLVNPGNGKLEIWSVRDDSKNLIALDQKTWLRTWEVFN